LAKLGIATPPSRGDAHGSSHVHSPTIKIEVNPTRLVQSFNVTVPLIVNTPGFFYAIGALQFYTYERDFSNLPLNATAEHRYDMANAADMSLITYDGEFKILTVSKGVKAFTYTLIACACISLLFLLYQTIKHRDNNVIKVSQGNFLIVYLLAALFASVSAIFFEPKNDIYCIMVNPMVYIPLQLMYSITIGRLWRIQAVLSPLLLQKLHQEKGLAQVFGKFLGNITSCTYCKRRRDESSSLR